MQRRCNITVDDFTLLARYHHPMNPKLESLTKEFIDARNAFNAACDANNDAQSDDADYWLERQIDLGLRLGNLLADTRQ